MALELKFEMMGYPKLDRLSLGRYETVDRVRIYLLTSNGVEITLHTGELLKDVTGSNLYFITGLPWVDASSTIDGLKNNIDETFLLNNNTLYAPSSAARRIVKALAEMVDFNVLHFKDGVAIDLLNIG